MVAPRPSPLASAGKGCALSVTAYVGGYRGYLFFLTPWPRPARVTLILWSEPAFSQERSVRLVGPLPGVPGRVDRSQGQFFCLFKKILVPALQQWLLATCRYRPGRLRLPHEVTMVLSRSSFLLWQGTSVELRPAASWRSGFLRAFTGTVTLLTYQLGSGLKSLPLCRSWWPLSRAWCESQSCLTHLDSE